MRSVAFLLGFCVLSIATADSAKAQSLKQDLRELRRCFSINGAGADDSWAGEIAFTKYGIDTPRSYLSDKHDTLVVLGKHPFTGKPALLSYSFGGEAKYFSLPESFGPGPGLADVPVRLCTFGEKCKNSGSIRVDFRDKRAWPYISDRFGLFKPEAGADFGAQSLYGIDFWDLSTPARTERTLGPLRDELVSRLRTHSLALTHVVERWYPNRNVNDGERNSFEAHLRREAERFMNDIESCKKGTAGIPGLTAALSEIQSNLRLRHKLPLPQAVQATSADNTQGVPSSPAR